MWQFVMAGAQLLGGVAEGKNQARQLARQAALDEFEARNALETAREQATTIYARAATIRGEQMAQIAASGVVVGDGSAAAILDETNKMARRDATAALYTGGRQAAALRSSASQRMRQRDDAVAAGWMKGLTSAGTTLLASGAFKGGGGGSELGSVGETTVSNTAKQGLSSGEWASFRGY